MIVAIASGKGGTGKTLVTASLAGVWKRPLLAVDLDVEEPNLHLFLRPDPLETETVQLPVPLLDEARCTHCGACAELCQFKAISLMGHHLLLFPDMCHSCGGCMRICPEGALGMGQRELGQIERGQGLASIPCWTGRLRIGEAMSPPLMRRILRDLKKTLQKDSRDVLIDAPPGVSCPAMTAVQEADVLLLVTEPTPFGLHDLRLAWQAFLPLRKPMGVLLNRAGLGDDRVQDFCQEKGLPILAELPFRREIAQAYAQGRILAHEDTEMRSLFETLAQNLKKLGQQEASHA